MLAFCGLPQKALLAALTSLSFVVASHKEPPVHLYLEL